MHYWDSDRLLKFIPKRDFPLVRVYKKQDNIPWYVKIIWLLYITACSSAFLVFLGYWLFIFTACEDSDEDEMTADMFGNDTTDIGASGSGGSGEQSQESCSFLDVHTIQVHGVNCVIVFLDLALSRIPYQFLHIVYSILFTAAYIIFSLIYWGAGGENHEGQPYIYSTLDYGGKSSSGFLAAAVVVSPMLTFIVLFLFALLRDLVSVRIGCCFRDVKRLPYRDDDNHDLNGVADDYEDMTKV